MQVPLYESPHFKHIIYLVLIRMIDINKQREFQPSPNNFDLATSNKINLRTYVYRIFSYQKCSKSLFVLALIYIDRIHKKEKKFRLTTKNVFKVFALAMIMAIKAHQDIFYTNVYYAKVAGISIEQFNELQEVFFELLHFQGYVSSGQFEKYLKIFGQFSKKNQVLINELEEIHQKESNKQISIRPERQILKKIRQMFKKVRYDGNNEKDGDIERQFLEVQILSNGKEPQKQVQAKNLQNSRQKEGSQQVQGSENPEIQKNSI